jgi:hypothetical protein
VLLKEATQMSRADAKPLCEVFNAGIVERAFVNQAQGSLYRRS